MSNGPSAIPVSTALRSKTIRWKAAEMYALREDARLQPRWGAETLGWRKRREFIDQGWPARDSSSTLVGKISTEDFAFMI